MKIKGYFVVGGDVGLSNKMIYFGYQLSNMILNRKQFIRNLAATISALSLTPNWLLAAVENFGQLVKQIGNTNNEKTRAKMIEEALQSSTFTRDEKAILESVFFVADRWANGFEKFAHPGLDSSESNGYLCGFLKDAKIDKYLLPQLEESNPAFPLIAFYRSRMLLANLIQHGGLQMVPHIREAYLNESFRLLEVARKSFPQNTLIPAYLGNPEQWSDLVPTNPRAPEWANLQRKVLEKLTYLIHWWVDNRQISDGQFGGGWGDDVEIWRNWVPVLFAFEDAKSVESQQKLFEGLYAIPRMSRGYTTSFSDVEHTSEEYADPLTCMLNMQPENPVWEDRVLMALEYIENQWAGVNERGFIQFKSTWFNVDRIDLDEKRACDSPYHTRLVQPLMLLWLRTGNERVGSFLQSWLKTWIDATFREERRKPKGIIPTAIHWPDGGAHGTGKDWWKPENYHTPLYDYPSQQSSMYECFLQAYHMTKDELFLKPIRFIGEQKTKGVGDEKAENYEEGSLNWCLATLGDTIPKILFKYRLITGDYSFDQLLRTDAKDYERFMLDGNLDLLTESLEKVRASLSLPEEFYTTEVRWTDRLFAFSRYFNFILQEPMPSFDAGFLFSCLTGSVGDFKIMPVFGVKWLTPPTEIAILTETNTAVEYKAQLFHFGEKGRSMGAKLYNLEKGKFRLQITGQDPVVVDINEDDNIIKFTLPAQTLVVLQISKV